MDSEPKVMSVNNTQDVWSLGCDITVSDMGVVIQETSVDDISLSGSISIQEIPVNIDTDKKNILPSFSDNKLSSKITTFAPQSFKGLS